jgi:endonuclease IV
VTPLGSNRDRHANLCDGLIGDGLAVFLGNPRLQHLPAVVETEGQHGKGADAEEIRKLRELWKRGVGATRRRRAKAAPGAKRGRRVGA